LAGAWRWIYVVSALLALYFNCFVGVAQSFQKVAFLHPLAPTGSEPPFLVAQLAVMAIFIAIGVLAVKRYHPAAAGVETDRAWTHDGRCPLPPEADHVCSA